MEKAKQAVKDFVSHDGQHRTTVDETVRNPVTEEHRHAHQHENVTTAVDREVHQHHHHTTVQPINHKETLPEQHTHNLLPTEHKEFHHDSPDDTRARLEQDAAKYKDSSVKHDTTHSSTTAPTVEGERIHHHVHEHVQPVINKEVHQPKVVHTTVPVHETHHVGAVHHGTTVLPATTLEEFRSGNNDALQGRATRKIDEFDGCPKPYNKELQREYGDADKDVHTGLHSHHHDHHTGTTGINNTAKLGSSHTNTVDSTNPRAESGIGGHNVGTGVGGVAGAGHHNSAGAVNNTTNDTTGNVQGKPSLATRLNPFKDADGDGKKGIMD